MTTWLFAQVARQESVTEKALLTLPGEAVTWAVRSSERCVGTLSYQLIQRDLSWIEIEGRVLLQYEKREWPVTVKAYFFFNQLQQLFSSTIKFQAESYTVSVESHDINPLRIALDVVGTVEPIRYETQLPGPVLLERDRSDKRADRFFLTSPHRIRRSGKELNLLPTDWPISMDELTAESLTAASECGNANNSLDLATLLPMVQRFIPAFQVLPFKLIQDSQGAHA